MSNSVYVGRVCKVPGEVDAVVQTDGMRYESLKGNSSNGGRGTTTIDTFTVTNKRMKRDINKKT